MLHGPNAPPPPPHTHTHTPYRVAHVAPLPPPHTRTLNPKPDRVATLPSTLYPAPPPSFLGIASLPGAKPLATST